MESRIVQELKIYIENLKNRMSRSRLLTVFLITCFFMELFLSVFRENIALMGVKTNSVVLPFLQTSNYFMRFILLEMIYFYSNVPFMEKTELFYFNRLGKERWGWRNIVYIISSAFLMALFFVILSMIQVLPVAQWSLTWDGAMKTIALTGGENLGFQVPYQIMKKYTPLLLLGYTVLLDWIVIIFFAMLMYAISLSGKRILACVVATFMAFLPSIDARWGGILTYYSPGSWLNCSNWRTGYDNTKPDMTYMLTAGIFTDIILILYCQHRVKKMEWKSLND